MVSPICFFLLAKAVVLKEQFQYCYARDVRMQANITHMAMAESNTKSSFEMIFRFLCADILFRLNISAWSRWLEWWLLCTLWLCRMSFPQFLSFIFIKLFFFFYLVVVGQCSIGFKKIYRMFTQFSHTKVLIKS